MDKEIKISRFIKKGALFGVLTPIVLGVLFFLFNFIRLIPGFHWISYLMAPIFFVLYFLLVYPLSLLEEVSGLNLVKSEMIMYSPNIFGILLILLVYALIGAIIGVVVYVIRYKKFKS